MKMHFSESVEREINKMMMRNFAAFFFLSLFFFYRLFADNVSGGPCVLVSFKAHCTYSVFSSAHYGLSDVSSLSFALLHRMCM